MSKPKTINLGPGESIIAVVPEYCAGPGWSNAPAWVYIVNHQANTYRTESIQPDERTAQMHTLFALGEQAHRALMGAVPTKATKDKP